MMQIDFIQLPPIAFRVGQPLRRRISVRYAGLSITLDGAKHSDTRG